MERLIRYFVERHLLVHVTVAVVVTLGLFQATRSPRETFPDVTLPRLIVVATLPGASAQDVEAKVTIPIQEVIEELHGVKEFETTVSIGSTKTAIEFNDSYDRAQVRDAERDLRTLIDGISDFPPEMEDDPVVEWFNPKRMPVVDVALSGPTTAIIEAGRLLERRLRRIEEVSKVELAGLQDPEARILVDPDRARENGVTLLDVVDAVGRRNVSATGGMLESESDRRQVVVWSRFSDPREVAETIIRFDAGGGAVTVGDVARVEIGREDTGLIAHTGGRPGITVVVYKQADADIVTTVAKVRAEIEATTLPEGVSWFVSRDESFMTRNRLELMLNNGVIGALLVAGVLFVFLTPVSAGWTLAGIPVVFLGTLALFPVLGFSINMVTLTGLMVVLGMVVDDAVVVSERIVSRRQSGEERHVAAVRGATEMLRPIFASAITTMLAFLPLWGLGGMSGKMIVAMPAVVILALCLSIAESFMILPAHMSMGTRRASTPKRAFVVRAEERYRRVLRRTLDHRPAVVASFAVVLLVVFAVIAPSLRVVLYPDEDSEAFYARVVLPPGTPIERTEAVVAALERQISEDMGSDLTAVTARIGHQSSGRMDAEPARGSAENEAIITAYVVQTGRERTAGEWITHFEQSLWAPPDANIVYEVEGAGPPVGRPIAVHVAARRDDLRRSTALEIAQWIEAVPGVTGVDVDERPGTPQIDLAIDYPKLARRGLDPQRVAQTVQAAFHGMIASEHRDLDDTTDFRVMLDPSARRDLDSLLDLPLRSRTGELLKLRDVVTPIEMPAVARIHHRDGRRAATVTAGFDPDADHTPLSFAERLEKEVFPLYANVPGLELSIGGEAEETRKTTGEMQLIAALAFGGIALVITLMLGSVLEALFIVSIIPFALAAVILAFFLHGQPLSMFAMMGAIGLSGVVVNSSIVMVDAIHRRTLTLDTRSPERYRETVIDAVVGRLRPIVVTTLTTLGGVLPMAYGIGGYDSIVSPMSLAIGWGLLFSTGVTLFLVPTLFTLARDLRMRDREERPRLRPVDDDPAPAPPLAGTG
jgi:multidrug efflux pump subunit AcrB